MRTTDAGPVDTRPAEAYEHYFVPAIFTPWGERLLRHAAPRRGERVLDLACGTGAMTRLVAPLVGDAGRVVAVDVNPAMLAVARSLPAPGGAAVEWREGEAGNLPLEDGAVDLVLCQQGLQFFPDRAGAAREMRRVLARLGRAAVAVWKGLEHQPVYAALMEAEARHLGRPLSDLATPFSMDDPLDLHTVLAAGGFQRVEITEETGVVRFPSSDRFLELTVRASAAVIHEMAKLDDAAVTELIAAVERDVAPVLRRYREGEAVAFPMTTHVAVARA